MEVDEIQDVEAGKPDEAVEKEMPVGPVLRKSMHSAHYDRY